MQFRTTHFAQTQEEQDRLDHLKGQIAWAEKILSEPAIIYQNGRNSHEVAHEIWSNCQDEMIDFLGIVLV